MDMMRVTETLCSLSRPSLQVAIAPNEPNTCKKPAERGDNRPTMDMEADMCWPISDSESTHATDSDDCSDCESIHASESDGFCLASTASAQYKSVSFNEVVETIEFIIDVRESMADTEHGAFHFMEHDVCDAAPDDEEDLKADLEHWHAVEMSKTHRSVTQRGCGKFIAFGPPAASKLWRRRRHSVGE
jgi:hypothetical protein